MENGKSAHRTFVSYVSLHRDLGGSGPGIGGLEDSSRPAVAIARHLAEAGKAPDKVVLLWERDFLLENGKGDAERERLRQLVQGALPNAEIKVDNVVFDRMEDANDYPKAFSILNRHFNRIFGEKAESDEFFVNVSTGTHAVQMALFVLTMRQPSASVVNFASAPEGDDRGGSQILVTNVSRQTRKVEAQESRAEAVEESRADPTIDVDVLERIKKIAPLAVDPILLLGETGTGKTWWAEKITEYRKVPGRKIVAVNCATLGSLADSELFGHVQGAFTGAVKDHRGFVEQADGGVLFLDEIGLLSPEVQGKLLKVLDNGKFRRMGDEKEKESHFFLVCGTNENLEAKVKSKDRDKDKDQVFRRDLYERIRTWTFTMPSLKERLERRPSDLDEFVDDFLKQFNKEFAEKRGNGTVAPMRLSQGAKNYLKDNLGKMDLSGNFRALRRLVRRAATLAMAEGLDTIGPEIFEQELKEAGAANKGE